MKQKIPFLVVSDCDGNLFELPPYLMTGMSLMTPLVPGPSDIIELPFGSNLYMLSGRYPIGFDPRTKLFTEITEYEGNPLYAASAFMAPAYMQLLRSAYGTYPKAPRLPFYSYSALGWMRGKFYVSGIRVDDDERQDLCHVDLGLIQKKAQESVKKFKTNRLVRHLVDNCVCKYGCPAARNFVLGRWEAPLPTSPSCNSGCIGCISKQPETSGVVSSQNRITFVPTPEEVIEIAVYHLTHAPRPVVSFGQGCEGEPLMCGELLEESIKAIRKQTDRGIINLNTNGSKPEIVKRLCEAGLDSIRVSLNSARHTLYDKYYKPRNYSFFDCIESLRIIRRFKRWSSVNYFIFPGITDSRMEIDGLSSLIKDVHINMIQTRNLNMDPEWYINELGYNLNNTECCGLTAWLTRIRTDFPWIKIGYFNPPREEMKQKHYEFSSL